MSAITKRFPKISRHPEAMMLRFADRRPKVSLEIADNFIVDFSADNDITGLEILWDDADRAGSESALLAFGTFSAAVVWLGYHYEEHERPKMCDAALRKAKDFIAATGSQLRVTANGPNGLTIADADGRLLLGADFQYHPRHAIIRGYRVPAAQMKEIRSAIDRLSQNVLPANRGAIGIAVAVDEFSLLRRQQPIEPGRWNAWPKSRSAHLAIIPPRDCYYPWLPKHFLDFRIR